MENPPPIEIDSTQLSQAITRTQKFLILHQKPEGYWIGELEADASVSAGYISLMYYMTGEVDQKRSKKVIHKVLEQQNQDGSWSAFFSGAGDLSVSIQTYLGLKLGGIDSQDPCMLRARDFILEQGGIQNANIITKVWLALFGQYDWRDVPSIPPEIIYFPSWFYFNIYEFASWSRATIMALTILLTYKPICETPENVNIDELYCGLLNETIPNVTESKSQVGWKRFFLIADRICKLYDKLAIQPGRKRLYAKWRSGLSRIRKKMEAGEVSYCPGSTPCTP